MLSYVDFLMEMARPTETMRGMRYYHGSRHPDFRAVMRDGLQGQEAQGKSQLAPVAGRVYITSDLAYAVMYALGGNFTSMMAEGSKGENGDGYVFVIEGSALDDVQPDEDSVGEFICNNARCVGDRYRWDAVYTCSSTDPVIIGLWNRIRQGMTPNQFKKCLQGEYGYWAAGGKRALKNLSDEDKIALINLGAHVAHGGETIHPSEAWRINTSQIRQLKKDASNFFEIAERVA